MSTLVHNPSPASEQKVGHHALVIGGSIAGLLAARVLADYFDQVTILDRDTFPETPDHRKGIPQSHHAHVLLPKGVQIISQMFPGILDELRADGALCVSGVVPIAFVTPAGRLPAQKQDREFIAFSRSLLEWHIRHRLLAQTNVCLYATTEVTGLLWNSNRTQVIGVHTRERGGAGHSDTRNADLIVDASGRYSQVLQWLTTAGQETPPVETINSQIGYASRFYVKPDDFPNEWLGLIINRRPPHNLHSGIILPVDNGRWHVTLGGSSGHYPPLDERGFLQWARELPDPSVYETLRVARPLGPIRGYRTPENYLRHFERQARWPSGFIVTGDAVCTFNPIYGQGMTVSALEAQALSDCLSAQQQRPQPGFERRFQKRIARTVAIPWMTALEGDLRWPGVNLSGARPSLKLGLTHRYLDLVLLCAVENLTVAGAFRAVQGMLAPPHSLVKPRILFPVLRSACKRMLRRMAGRSASSQQLALSPEALAFLRAKPEESRDVESVCQ
ncbi:MAG TPA: hypothetical protein VFN35_19920 [Ktedonobacteraceae bacterium]|nr:hypothetical protein [Ktedonobacteraceae bacterium]